jgi:DMSO reductase family type II enzyme heme b subunit
MPGWSSALSDKEMWQTVHYIKGLSERFAWYKEINKVPGIVEIGSPLPVTKEGLEIGRKLYMEKLECWKCHGEEGRGDGPSAPELFDEWEYPIKATNLTKPWKFKIGNSKEDIYRAIISGFAGTPMPSFLKGNTEEELWDLVNYVDSLGIKKRPEKAIVLKPKYVSSNLPEDVEGPLWDSIESMEFPLFGQILVAPKMYTPSADAVYVKSVYNDTEIAFLIEWDDINQSKSGIMKVTYENEDGEEEEEEITVYADSLAIQFPVQIPETTSSPRPFFLMGDHRLPVNLWSWDSDTGSFTEANAKGINKKKDQPEESNNIKGNVVYNHGQYKMLVKRDLVTSDNENDIQMAYNKFIPISFFVWDGHNEETETKMALSSWYYLFLEKEQTSRIYLYTLFAFLITAIAEIIFIKSMRKSE